MNIINSNTLFEDLKESLKEHRVITIPIFMSTVYHPKLNGLSLIYIYSIDSDQGYMIPIDHYDCDISFITRLNEFQFKNNFVLNKHDLGFFIKLSDSVDFDIIHYITVGYKYEQPEQDYFNFYNSIYFRRDDVAKIMPITKHIEYCRKVALDIKDKILSTNREIYKFYLLESAVFTIIENNGIAIDRSAFISRFGDSMVKDNIVHTKYNMYTMTGRPSNSFGGVNFGALNKSDGTREMFKSRYKNGKLIEMDYDGYHLRLIASLIDYKFTDESIHIQLGKLYFNKSMLSNDEYELSKSITFKALYGFIPKEYENIDFFIKIKIFINELWNSFNIDGYVTSPVSGRKFLKRNFKEITKTNLFNYYIQLYETERNILVMKNLISYLKGKSTKLILYLYDAFLFDLHSEEEHIIPDLKQIISEDGYNIKTKMGINYNNLKELEYEL